MRTIVSLAAAVILLFSPLQLLSSNIISLSSTEPGRIGIAIDNSEPIGCVQFSLTSHGGAIHKISRSTRLNANWSAASNIKGDTVAYVVIYNLMGDVLTAGKGEWITIECDPSDVSAAMTVTIGDMKATGLHGGLVALTAAGTVIPVANFSGSASGSSPSISADRNVVIAGNYPNPFNPSTTISFAVRQASFVTLHVYDIAGRLVKVLNTGELGEGTHSFQWNGTNAAGMPVASGTYFVKLQTPAGVMTHKMLLSK